MSSTTVTEELFGKTRKDEQVKKFKLSNKNCYIEAEVITYGATLTALKVPDKHGGVIDVILGFDDIKGYEGIPDKNPYMGAVCGRVTNRISKASFTHNDQQYKLTTNEGSTHIHGGTDGWSMAVWNTRVEGGSVILSHTSEDGDQGYPGRVTAYVTYTMTDDGELCVKFSATTDKTTPIDLTSHGYYNLAGESHGCIKDHIVSIYANHYLEVEKSLLPTGKIIKVENTPFDLRKPVLLGEAMAKVPGGGYVHNFCLNGPTGRRKAARVSHPDTGIVMEVYTDQKGLVFYTSDLVNVTNGKSGGVYSKYSGFCMETQGYVDAVNQSNFPDPFLEPGSEYQHTVWYKFGIDKC